MSQYATQEEIEAVKLTPEEAEFMRSWLAGEAGGTRCCGSHDVWVKGYYTRGIEWCSQGASGTHMRYALVCGCHAHQEHARTLGRRLGRSCALDCDWAHEGEAEPEESYSAYDL